MRKLRKVVSTILICSIVIFSNVLFTNDIAIAQASANIRLSDTALTLELGHYKTSKIYGTTAKASWRSSNNWVATVSSSGKITAKAVGTATITAAVSGKKLTCKVTVIRMRKKTLTMAIGQTKALTVSGTKSLVTWTTTDPLVATVSDNGEVTAVAAGVTSVIASVDGKALTGTVTVVDINKKDVIMEIGGFSGYTYHLKINNTTSKITWASSNTSIAIVSSNGTVSAKGTGSVTITASVDGVILTSNIKVIGENIRTFTLKMGETKKLEILGTTSKVKWHSNNKTVVLVTDDGTVSTVAPGSAIIMAYVDGRNVKSRVTVVE